MIRIVVYLAMISCFTAVLACSPADESASQPARPAETRPRSETDGVDEVVGVDEVDDETLRLRALGYVEFAPEPADSTQVGVVELDSSRAQPGHTLVTLSAECSAQLIDLAGTQLHRWEQADCASWSSAALLPDGDLVVNGKREIATHKTASSGESDRAQRRRNLRRYTARISREGDVVWLHYMRSHHQIDWTAASEALVLTESRLAAEDFHAALPEFVFETRANVQELNFHDNSLNWISADGKLRKSLSLFHAVTQQPSAFDFVKLATMLEGPKAVGLFHANSAYAINQPHLFGTDPIYAEGNVLVTSRNQNRIFIVDPRLDSVVWEWGKDELSGPHDGSWLPNGHLLVFDNGIEQDTTRVLEIDPHRKEIVWSYPNGGGDKFYCPTRGLAQRFENGNTLIVNSRAGEAFEVTASGERVWRYFIPFLPGNEKRPIVVSLKRYPESWLHHEIE